MPGFLIPLAGLALGALGQLFRNNRSMQSLQSANATASANTPGETSLATDASSRPVTSSGSQFGRQDTVTKGGEPTPTKTGGDPVSATQPATGPVQQNSGNDSPTPAAGQNAGLAARLGAEKVAESRRKNRDQQARVSNAALS